jgi:2-methylisocitrate lyase-like PEP mutase family enzyme
MDSKSLLALLCEEKITIFPGIYDGYSARLVAGSGFETATISGAGLSESRLGWADRGILTFKDNVNACAEIASCCDLKLVADADTGYGNAVNVHFTVKAFERTGVHCLSIEDQVFPKRCGHMSGKRLISLEEAKDKIKAAVDARVSDKFLIRARTDAANVDGLNAAIDRLGAYIDCGADCVFADAINTADEIKAITNVIAKPLFVNMGFGLRKRPTTPLISPSDLESMGVKAVSYPRLLTSAAVRGMRRAMEVFNSDVVGKGLTLDRPDLAVDFEELNELVGLDFLSSLEGRFVRD